jgi:hypothetical protein
MMASRGMGAINPSKMPKSKRKQRRDDTAFNEYADGGMTAKNPRNARAPEAVDEATSPGNIAGDYSTLQTKQLEPLRNKLQAANYIQAVRDIEEEQRLRKRLQNYASGGKVSRVNESGNYTKPGMRKALFNKIKGQATQGTAAGQWSARKAQLLAKKYKEKGGSYRG